MSNWEYYSFAESMFKRLYWQGYQGRFAALRWPTLSGDDFPVSNLEYFTYNKSEFRAFQSGKALSDYLTMLRQRFPDYSINLCAHSMGNIVASEALKIQQAANLQSINNYILMQAAVPAHCFDTNLPSYTRFLTAETELHTPNRYLGYLHGISSAVQDNIKNFFNTNDYALATGTKVFGSLTLQANWEGNQVDYKPDTFLGYSSDGTNGYRNSFLMADNREVMSFVARPRSQAVGARAGVGGAINGGEINLTSQFGFQDDRADHSAQFNWNIQQLHPFYRQLVVSMGLFSPTP